MNKRILPKYIIFLIAILCVSCSGKILFAQSLGGNSAAKENSDGLCLQARQYRESGLESQRQGNLAEAISYYQKAAIMNPGYAAVYNDLGVVYEAQGFMERAKENYLKSIAVDPGYLSAYTNLAFFYENQLDLKNAEFYWDKRVQLGSSDDPWTQEAVCRLENIRASRATVTGKPDPRNKDMNEQAGSNKGGGILNQGNS